MSQNVALPAVVFILLAIVIALAMFFFSANALVWAAVLIVALAVSWKMKRLPRKEKEFEQGE